MMWREIKCPLTHEPLSEGMCIDGGFVLLSLWNRSEECDSLL